MRWPSSPGKGGFSNPGNSRPIFTHCTIRAIIALRGSWVTARWIDSAAQPALALTAGNRRGASRARQLFRLLIPGYLRSTMPSPLLEPLQRACLLGAIGSVHDPDHAR